mgnify:CR=1 FL=1
MTEGTTATCTIKLCNVSKYDNGVNESFVGGFGNLQEMALTVRSWGVVLTVMGMMMMIMMINTL